MNELDLVEYLKAIYFAKTRFANKCNDMKSSELYQEFYLHLLKVEEMITYKKTHKEETQVPQTEQSHQSELPAGSTMPFHYQGSIEVNQ